MPVKVKSSPPIHLGEREPAGHRVAVPSLKKCLASLASRDARERAAASNGVNGVALRTSYWDYSTVVLLLHASFA
jgi:hypothetical protein